ncbi:unnamed protein product [Lactuca saligna]|uniref:Uncharacterized protein n=1 Tax=Lactuca saligna TaxID=75948 RepID=A0AA35Y4Z8_LACSI|nr:unnamed protein product [Lactuca saligna]
MAAMDLVAQVCIPCFHSDLHRHPLIGLLVLADQSLGSQRGEGDDCYLRWLKQRRRMHKPRFRVLCFFYNVLNRLLAYDLLKSHLNCFNFIKVSKAEGQVAPPLGGDSNITKDMVMAIQRNFASLTLGLGRTRDKNANPFVWLLTSTSPPTSDDRLGILHIHKPYFYTSQVEEYESQVEETLDQNPIKFNKLVSDARIGDTIPTTTKTQIGFIGLLLLWFVIELDIFYLLKICPQPRMIRRFVDNRY